MSNFQFVENKDDMKVGQKFKRYKDIGFGEYEYMCDVICIKKISIYKGPVVQKIGGEKCWFPSNGSNYEYVLINDLEGVEDL